MIYSTDCTHENSLHFGLMPTYAWFYRVCFYVVFLIGMLGKQRGWMTSLLKRSTVFNNKCVLIMRVCPRPDISVRCLKESVCLSRTGWRWMLPPRRQTLGWRQVYLRFSINRYLLYSSSTPSRTSHIIFNYFSKCVILFWIYVMCWLHSVMITFQNVLWT